MNRKLRFEHVLLITVLILGFALPLFQYLYNRSLWLDEAWLALNIIKRSHFQLLMPLDYIQVAPILFLQLEKIFASIFNNTEFGLRLLPLLSYYISVYFFYKIINILFKNIYVIIIALSFFVLNVTLIYYSSEVKQYMIDVLNITCIYYFALKCFKNINTQYIALGIIGVISIFISNTAPIVLLCIGIYLLLKKQIYKNGELKLFAIASTLWLLVFVIYYYFFIYHHPSMAKQVINFNEYFLPTNPFKIDFYQFLLKQYKIIFSTLIPYGIIGIFCLPIIALLGCYNLIINRKVRILILFLAPIVVHLVLSSFKLYPFISRLIIYIIPTIIIMISYGFDYILNGVETKTGIVRLRIITVFIVLLLSIITILNLPIERAEFKKSIEFVQKNINKDDKIYINFFAKYPYMYYKECKSIALLQNHIIFGDSLANKPYLEQIGNLKGRVWFVFTNFIKEDYQNLDEMYFYFNEKGYTILQEQHYIGSSVYLYHLPD